MLNEFIKSWYNNEQIFSSYWNMIILFLFIFILVFFLLRIIKFVRWSVGLFESRVRLDRYEIFEWDIVGPCLDIGTRNHFDIYRFIFYFYYSIFLLVDLHISPQVFSYSGAMSLFMHPRLWTSQNSKPVYHNSTHSCHSFIFNFPRCLKKN